MAITWKELAYKDDVAVLTSDAPADIGTTAAVGNGTTAARSNHVHDLGADCVDNSDKIADDVIGAEHIKDDAVGSEHIEQLSAALDFGGQQATDMVVMQSSNAPATAVVGKIYQDSDDQKLYICTSAS